MGDSKSGKGLGARIGRPLLAGAMAAGAVAAMATPATALADVFLKLGDIKGESTADKHKNEIDILSYTQSFSNSGTIGGGGALGRVTCGAVTVSKGIDRSSPAIIQLAVTGRHVKTAVVTFRVVGENPVEYYKVTMDDVLVTSINQSDSADPARIVESVSMLAAKFKFEYRPQRSDGSLGAWVTTAYDCTKGTAL